MSEQNKSKREGFRDGIRQGMGVLSAFKEAIEETISEARDRGDLSPERAKEVMRSALDRAQEAADNARERFDFVTQKDFDALVARVSELARRLESLDGLHETPAPAPAPAEAPDPDPEPSPSPNDPVAAGAEDFGDAP